MGNDTRDMEQGGAAAGRDVQSQDDNPAVLEMCRIAVDLARVHQIQRLEPLRSKMKAMYPDQEANIDAAIKLWAQQVQSRRFSWA